jgi:hypothetical protein
MRRHDRFRILYDQVSVDQPARDRELLRFLSRVVCRVDVFDFPRTDAVELHDGFLFGDAAWGS